MSLSSALQKGKAFFKSGSPSSSNSNLHNDSTSKAPTPASLFTKVDPTIDGEDCDHDCASCEVRLPKGFKIDETDELYGHVNGWATHALVATGKTDWVRDVADEKGSVMEAVGKWTSKNEPENGVCTDDTFSPRGVKTGCLSTETQKLMLSASNLPLPDSYNSNLPSENRPTTVLLLPAFSFIDNVTPASVPELMTQYIGHAPTTISPLNQPSSEPQPQPPSLSTSGHFSTRPCPHDAIILLCSQQTRDARCGKSAPLLKKEFERHLRPLGLYRDQHDSRPRGVGIYFISHVGGHKYSANVMVYRRAGAFAPATSPERTNDATTTNADSETDQGAAQCIWLARVRPEDCEGLIKFTVLQGKVVKPDRQLRGGFDRAKGLVSW